MATEEALNEEMFMKMFSLDTIRDCKSYLKLMLNFYFDVMVAYSEKPVPSQMMADANLWIQTIFTKGLAFLKMLDGNDFRRNELHLNPIIDPSLLFTVARRMYESLVIFELLFIVPDSDDKKTILYNLFITAGLSERLDDVSDDSKYRNSQRVADEKADIAACKTAIEGTSLYSNLSVEAKKVIENGLRSHKFRYYFNKDDMPCRVNFDKAYELLRIRKDIFEKQYSFFSLQGHPSYLALIQFRDAFKGQNPKFREFAKFATQCVLACMSIFIVDYMKMFPIAKTLYDNLGKITRFAIGMYEDALRDEHKFK